MSRINQLDDQHLMFTHDIVGHNGKMR